MIYHYNSQTFFIRVLFTVPFGHFLFSRYLRLTEPHLLLGILVPFPDLSDLYSSDNLLPDCAFGPFTYVCCKSCMSSSSAYVLNLSKSRNILFRKILNGNCLFSSESLSLVGEITHWCMNVE